MKKKRAVKRYPTPHQQIVVARDKADNYAMAFCMVGNPDWDDFKAQYEGFCNLELVTSAQMMDILHFQKPRNYS